MNMIEQRFAGHLATQSAIERFVNRHLVQGRWQRLELRYSTQAAVPLAPAAVRQALAALLREGGQGHAAVSVRPHEGPIDDAAGEHLLRLFPAEAVRPSQQHNAGGLRAWLARRFPRLFGDPVAQSAASAAGAESARPRVASAEAVALLQRAVAQAAAGLGSQIGKAGIPASAAGRSVTEAQIIVRLDAVHEVLGPMVAGDALRAAASVSAMLKVHGLVVLPDFKVAYRYQSRFESVGTSYASESDVEVRLMTPSDTGARVEPTLEPPAQAAGPHTLLPDAGAGAGQSPCATALPASGERPRPALIIRVRGTLRKDFPQPYELRFAELPVRFDRSALEQAGFGLVHPRLLAVASNSCPLIVGRGPGGNLHVHARYRAVPGAADAPMYYRRNSMAGLQGELDLGAGISEFVVNAPGGVRDPATGRLLPALVIEILAGSAAR